MLRDIVPAVVAVLALLLAIYYLSKRAKEAVLGAAPGIAGNAARGSSILFGVARERISPFDTLQQAAIDIYDRIFRRREAFTDAAPPAGGRARGLEDNALYERRAKLGRFGAGLR